jgi:hypothetical protein
MAPYIGKPLGDTNEDGKIDILDVVRIASYYGKTVPPAPDSCDINLDNKINIYDVVVATSHYGAYNTVGNSGFENGMLGWAFHPGYKGSWGYPCGRAYRGKYGFCMGSDIEFGDVAFICSLSQKPLPATKNFLFTIAIDGGVDSIGGNWGELVIQPLGIEIYGDHGGGSIWVDREWVDYLPYEWFLLELRQGDDGRTIVYLNNEKKTEFIRSPITLDGIELLLYAVGEATRHVEVAFDEVRVYRIV